MFRILCLGSNQNIPGEMSILHNNSNNHLIIVAITGRLMRYIDIFFCMSKISKVLTRQLDSFFGNINISILSMLHQPNYWMRKYYYCEISVNKLSARTLSLTGKIIWILDFLGGYQIPSY